MTLRQKVCSGFTECVRNNILARSTMKLLISKVARAVDHEALLVGGAGGGCLLSLSAFRNQIATRHVPIQKGARHSCRLNVNLSDAFRKKKTSDFPKLKRNKFRDPRFMIAIHVHSLEVTPSHERRSVGENAFASRIQDHSGKQICNTL